MSSFYTYGKQRELFNRKCGTPAEVSPDIFKEHFPNNAECYYLRLLLHTVRGLTSFNGLRVVDDVENYTYQDACQGRQMLDDDLHWDDDLAETCVNDLLFSMMLVFCKLSDATQLWQAYQNRLSENFLKKVQENIDNGIHPA